MLVVEKMKCGGCAAAAGLYATTPGSTRLLSLLSLSLPSPLYPRLDTLSVLDLPNLNERPRLVFGGRGRQGMGPSLSRLSRSVEYGVVSPGVTMVVVVPEPDDERLLVTAAPACAGGSGNPPPAYAAKRDVTWTSGSSRIESAGLRLCTGQQKRGYSTRAQLVTTH
jgi:hypothetical protein